MPYELFIGLRYLRARRREAFISLITIFSTVGVAIGVMTLNIVLAVMTGFEEDLRDRIVGFNPHIVVMNDFGAIDDVDRLLAEIRAIPGVAQASPFAYGYLMVSTAEHVSGLLVRGVVPDPSEAVDLARHLREGDVAQLGRRFAVPLADGRGATVELPGIMIGARLAGELGVHVGDAVSVAIPLPRASGSTVPRLQRFAIAGLFDSGMPEYDKAVGYMALGDARKLFALGERASSIEVKVEDLYSARRIAEQIAASLGPPYRARDWMRSNASLFDALRFQKTVYFIVLLLIILVAAFTILATLIMVVMEKRKDIAVLKSMGASPASIGRIFVLKGLIIGGVGTLAGSIAGYLGCWALRHYRFVDLPVEVFYVSTVPVRIYPQYFAVVIVASLLLCLLATLYPARQASRLPPVDLLRYE
jgi:lipoprotein-releasing system permease protein